MNKSRKTPVPVEPLSLPSDDWLTGLLYDLMRDCIPPGEMERIVQDLEKSHKSGESVIYSNSHLAKYAEHLAKRIRLKVDA